MAERQRLPDRRESLTFNFECGHRYTATVSYFPGTNQLAEIFLGNGRAGSDVDAAAKEFRSRRVNRFAALGAGRSHQARIVA